MATAQQEPLNANLAKLSKQIETTFAVVPGAASRAEGNPTTPTTGWTAMRFTGESLEGRAQTQQSGEITGDFMIADLNRLDLSASGTTNHEFTEDDYDDILLGNLGNAASSFTGSGAQTSFSIPASATIDDSSGVLEISATSIDATYAVGDWLYIDANICSDATVHGFHRVTAEASDTLTLETVTPTGFNTANLTQSATMYSSEAKANGTTFYSWSLVRELTDGSSTLFETFRGQFPGTITFDGSPAAFVRMNIDWIGADSIPTTTDPISGTPTAAGTDSPMTTPANQNVIFAGQTVGVARLQTTLGTGAQPRQRLGFLGAKSIGRRQTNPQMQCDFDLEDWPQSADGLDAFINKFSNETAFNAATWLQKGSTAYLIEIPSAKMNSTRQNVEGANTDVLQRVTVTGIRNTTVTASVRIHKWTTLSAAA